MRRGAWSGWRAQGLAVLVLACCLAAGCGAPAPTTPTPTASPSPQVTSDVELCTKLVGHWSREVLDGDTYGDYQSMGLSNGQYDILREVVDAARAAERAAERRTPRQSAESTGELIDREARRGCTQWYRDGGPGEGPWQ